MRGANRPMPPFGARCPQAPAALRCAASDRAPGPPRSAPAAGGAAKSAFRSAQVTRPAGVPVAAGGRAVTTRSSRRRNPVAGLEQLQCRENHRLPRPIGRPARSRDRALRGRTGARPTASPGWRPVRSLRQIARRWAPAQSDRRPATARSKAGPRARRLAGRQPESPSAFGTGADRDARRSRPQGGGRDVSAIKAAAAASPATRRCARRLAALVAHAFLGGAGHSVTKAQTDGRT